MASEEIECALRQMQADFTRQEGQPFEHFFCPILFKDEDTELCMGHVVNHAIPNSCRARVLQRADVDNFYGSFAEADFGTLMAVQEKGLRGVISDPNLRRKVRPRIEMDGKEVRYYLSKDGKAPASHSPVILEPDQGGKGIRMVFDKSPGDMLAAANSRWNLVIERDCRLSALVTMIKAAYLTLFRTHGYRWALSAAGWSVGHNILGKFYKENKGKPQGEARKVAAKFFAPFRHMVRPIVGMDGVLPRGTVEDDKAGVCFGSSGRPFALVVWIRVNEDLHAVLMPAFSHPDSVEAYLTFLSNDNESLRVSEAEFDREKQLWNVSPTPINAHWPKGSDTFDFDWIPPPVAGVVDPMGQAI